MEEENTLSEQKEIKTIEKSNPDMQDLEKILHNNKLPPSETMKAFGIDSSSKRLKDQKEDKEDYHLRLEMRDYIIDQWLKGRPIPQIK